MGIQIFGFGKSAINNGATQGARLREKKNEGGKENSDKTTQKGGGKEKKRLSGR